MVGQKKTLVRFTLDIYRVQYDGGQTFYKKRNF